MAEIVTLTSPITPPSLTTYSVRMIQMDLDVPTIVIRLRGTNGEIKTCSYAGATATTLMIALNKANLTSNSLQRRVLTQLIADGEISGTISGSPD
jgi:hypothetical protein